MGELNPDLARLFGSDDDTIYLAPIGSTLPTTIDGAPDAAFIPVGWISEDGIPETATGSVEKIRGHQGAAVVRQYMNETGTQLAFTALESKDLTFGMRYDEVSVTTATGVREATRNPGQKITAYAAVIDLFDRGDTAQKERFVIPRFEVSPNGERTAVNNAIASFPALGEIIGQYTHFASVPVVEP
ncbi:hypothetical protein [Microbacterium sp. ZXX196]|uniref:phage tail tube protein n=1 Tax=Microbacterium sp. ZXX196 TaxID=2609291 RepID=UPI0012B78BD7|nr:hypothetical protein [Microbacterium sp. ZXX196]MTE24828.1 hypothetical protein [Microbacterium sp. ZXX196]